VEIAKEYKLKTQAHAKGGREKAWRIIEAIGSMLEKKLERPNSALGDKACCDKVKSWIGG
jgi:hypothetical protein